GGKFATCQGKTRQVANLPPHDRGIKRPRRAPCIMKGRGSLRAPSAAADRASPRAFFPLNSRAGRLTEPASRATTEETCPLTAYPNREPTMQQPADVSPQSLAGATPDGAAVLATGPLAIVGG